MTDIIIEEEFGITPEVLKGVKELFPQLSPELKTPDDAEITRIIQTPHIHLLLAKKSGQKHVLGMATLVVYESLSGTHTVVEDVVVDKSARRQGIATELLTKAISTAKESNAKFVDLTSRPSRVEANELYKKLGFSLRETNVYRYEL